MCRLSAGRVHSIYAGFCQRRDVLWTNASPCDDPQSRSHHALELGHAIHSAQGTPTGQHFLDPKLPEDSHILLDLKTRINGAMPHQRLGPHRVHHRLEVRLIQATLLTQRPDHNALSPAIHHHLGLFHCPRTL